MVGLVDKIGRKWSNLTTVSHLCCIFSSLTMLIVLFLFDLVRFSKEYIIFSLNMSPSTSNVLFE